MLNGETLFSVMRCKFKDQKAQMKILLTFVPRTIPNFQHTCLCHICKLFCYQNSAFSSLSVCGCVWNSSCLVHNEQSCICLEQIQFLQSSWCHHSNSQPASPDYSWWLMAELKTYWHKQKYIFMIFWGFQGYTLFWRPFYAMINIRLRNNNICFIACFQSILRGR